MSTTSHHRQLKRHSNNGKLIRGPRQGILWIYNYGWTEYYGYIIMDGRAEIGNGQSNHGLTGGHNLRVEVTSIINGRAVLRVMQFDGLHARDISSALHFTVQICSYLQSN